MLNSFEKYIKIKLHQLIEHEFSIERQMQHGRPDKCRPVDGGSLSCATEFRSSIYVRYASHSYVE